MNKKELLHALKIAMYVFGGVTVTKDEMAYIELKKVSVKIMLHDFSDTTIFNAEMRGSDLYIN